MKINFNLGVGIGLFLFLAVLSWLAWVTFVDIRPESSELSSQMVIPFFFGALLVAIFFQICFSMATGNSGAKTKDEVDELKRVTTLARQAQILLQASIESLEGVIFLSIDPQYQYLNFNSRYRDTMLASYNRVVEVGMNLLDSLQTDQERRKSKADFDRALAGESHITVEKYGVHGNTYEIRYNPIFDDSKIIIGASAFASDITERLRIEKRINEMAAVVASSDDAIISKSLDGNIITWNQGAQKLFGYKPEEVVGRHISILIPENLAFEEAYIIDNVKRGKLIHNYETTRLRKDKSLIPVSLTISPIKDNAGNITSISKIARDITEQKEAEERIKTININLEEAKHAAELANRTKSQFLANMSHEIRTPLNAVIGLSHLALRTDLTPKQSDYLKKIQSSSDSLLGIINDILDFSKVESGKIILEEVSFDLEEIFQKVANVIAYKANAKGLEIAFGIDSQVPTYLIGDPGRLEQILVNLCSNSVKFTHAGDVIVTVTVKEDSDERIRLKFEVVDTGIGMDEMQISKLFVPFTQADDSISRKYGGTGLGLSIIKRLIELMEGQVSVESEPGKGSRFYFDLWLKKQKHQRKIPVPSLDLRKLNVLLVDDNPSAREIMREALESLSFNVTTVGSGIQAVHYLKNNYHHNPVKLILLDWAIGDMDGIDTAKIIRQDNQFADVRIIMMSTSYASEELYENAEQMGISGVLIKPIRYSMLYDLIIKTLEQTEGGIKTTAPIKESIHREITEMFQGNLLLVEDNEINQQVARELLEGFGFTVEIASNGLEAVHRVRDSGSPSKYDLILMDLQMPIMGGRAATIEIRKLAAYQGLPIIAMTADAMQKVQEECFEIGMNDFISKPINPNKMLETIVKWLKSSNTSNTALKNRKDIPEIPELEGVDIQDGLSHLGGNRKLFYDMLLKFKNNNDTFQTELLNSFDANDQSNVQRMMHTMKGVSGNLGMIRLHGICMTLEESMRSTPVAFAMMEPFMKEMNTITKAIGRNLTEASLEVADLIPGKVLPQLIELEESLRDQNPDAVQTLEKIGIIAGLELETEKLKGVVAKYDFEGALKILEKMKRQIN